MAVFDQDIIGNFIAFFSEIAAAVQSKWWYAIIALIIVGVLVFIQQFIFSLNWGM